MKKDLTPLFLGAALFAIALLIVKLNDVIKQRGERKREHRTKGRSVPSSSSWLWYVLIGVVALITFLIRPTGKVGPQAPSGASPWALFIAPAVLLGLFAVCLLISWLRHRDPIIARALKRADGGDVDGAIGELRGGIETRGAKPNRLNALGCLYLQKDAPQDALGWFLEAEDRGGRRPVFQVNRAVALRKLGRLEESAAILGDVCSRVEKEPAFACLYCHVLADLGRRDEASDQLRRAEELIKVRMNPASIQRGREAAVQECRDRLGEKPKAPWVEGLEEL